MPAEWEPQSAVQLTWPTADTDWEPILNEVEPVYQALVAAIAARQSVIISCSDPQVLAGLESRYQAHRHIQVHWVLNNDTWARDHGPISCYETTNGRTSQLKLLDFEFNGWGGKYESAKDNRISSNLHRLGAYGSHTMEKHALILEGGSLESDGQGTLLTTKECLLNPNRNAHLNQAELETALNEALGFERFIWLEQGALQGDDTDAHIDTLARFCSADSIAYCQASPDDEHYESLSAMERELQSAKQADGTAYRLIPLPLPSAIYNKDGDRLPATYANFLIIEGAVLLPVYGVQEDHLAIERMIEAFPNHMIQPIYCRPIIEQHGSLHCLTMQIHASL